MHTVSQESVNGDHHPEGNVWTLHEVVVAQSSCATSAFYHVMSFLRISLVTQSLMARFLHQFFEELERYDHAPSVKAQHTWIGGMIIGVSAVLAIIAKIVNMQNRSRYRAAQDYLFSIFSSSIVYMFLDFFAPGGDVKDLPLAWFIIISAVSLPVSAGIFWRLVLPDSASEYCLNLSHLSALQLPQFPNVTPGERRLNLLAGASLGLTSLTPLLWVVNREIQGRTVELPQWQLGLIVLYLTVTAKIGYEISDHPNFFHAFSALSKIMREGSLIYAALSGIVYMAAVMSCDNQQFCLSDTVREMLTYTCFFLSLSLGIFCAATTKFRAQENHEANEVLLEKISAASAACQQRVSACWRKYCTRDELPDASLLGDHQDLSLNRATAV